MTTTEDRLATALRSRAAGVAVTPDTSAVLARSRQLRRRRVGASVFAALAVAALVVTEVGIGGHRRAAEPGAQHHVFAPVEAGPLTLRVSASQVALGSTVFIWGGQRTTAAFHGPSGTPDGRELLADGAIYSADSGRWRRVAPSPLSPRKAAPAVATPRGVVVVGGSRQGDRLTPDQRSGALYDPLTDRWSSLPDAPFCPRVAVPQGSLVYAYGTTCGTDQAPAFGWYDVDLRRWHRGPLPPSDTRELLPYQGSVVALGRQGSTEQLSPRGDSWSLLDPLPTADNTQQPPVGTDRVTDFVTAWDATTLYAVGQVDFGRKGTAVFSMSGHGWVEVGRLLLDGSSPQVQPPARFGVEASVQDGVLVWHAERGISWFRPSTFDGGFVPTTGSGPGNAIVATPLVPVADGRFLWWGGYTGDQDPRTHRELSAGTLVVLP